MRTKKAKTNPQENCVSFKDAVAKIGILNLPETLVSYFKFTVVSPEGNKLTMAFDAKTVK